MTRLHDTRKSLSINAQQTLAINRKLKIKNSIRLVNKLRDARLQGMQLILFDEVVNYV